MVWALEEAPDVPAHCVGTLMGLANHADPQGRGAYAGQKLVADYARKTDRAVRNDLTQLAELELIREGDQRIAAHIPADSRPVVWDLALERKQTSAPFSASAEGLASPTTADQMAKRRGSGSQLPSDRQGDGSTLPPESEGAEAHFRGERKPASYKPKNSSTKSSTRPRNDLNEGRDDAMRLCVHLADRVEANGNLRPKVNKDWLDDARLLMDKDGRREDQIHKAIDWCQANTFWRKNVMSMPTLRDKYDRLRMEADDERKAEAARKNGSSGKPGAEPPLVGVSPRDEHRYRR